MKLTSNLSCSRYEWAEQCLRKKLSEAPSSVVNDIGAGEGKMSVITRELGGVWYGFDLSPKVSEIRSWNLDSSAPHSAHPAGMVILLDVLEHLNNPWLAMQHVADVLLPGAFLVLTVPNPRWSRSRWHAIAKGDLICFTQPDLEFNHHVFTPWPHIVEKLLIDSGFLIEEYVTLDGHTKLPGKPYNFRYPLRCAFSLLNFTIESRDSTACGMSYGILAKKK